MISEGVLVEQNTSLSVFYYCDTRVTSVISYNICWFLCVVGTSSHNDIAFSLQQCHISVLASQITGNSNICSTACSASNKWIIEGPHHWLLVRETTGHQWIPLTKRQWWVKLCYIMPWSYVIIIHFQGQQHLHLSEALQSHVIVSAAVKWANPRGVLSPPPIAQGQPYGKSESLKERSYNSSSKCLHCQLRTTIPGWKFVMGKRSIQHCYSTRWVGIFLMQCAPLVIRWWWNSWHHMKVLDLDMYRTQRDLWQYIVLWVSMVYVIIWFSK